MPSLSSSKAGRPDIDSFETAMHRENRPKSFLVAFDYTQDALDEIETFYRREHEVIVAFTVPEILEGTLRGRWGEGNP